MRLKLPLCIPCRFMYRHAACLEYTSPREMLGIYTVFMPRRLQTFLPSNISSLRILAYYIFISIENSADCLIIVVLIERKNFHCVYINKISLKKKPLPSFMEDSGSETIAIYRQ
jgi:hypothetical protein